MRQGSSQSKKVKNKAMYHYVKHLQIIRPSGGLRVQECSRRFKRVPGGLQTWGKGGKAGSKNPHPLSLSSNINTVLPCGEHPGKFFNALLLCEAPPHFVKILQIAKPFHNLYKIFCRELRPWRHLKWHLIFKPMAKYLLHPICTYKPLLSRIG